MKVFFIGLAAVVSVAALPADVFTAGDLKLSLEHKAPVKDNPFDSRLFIEKGNEKAELPCGMLGKVLRNYKTKKFDGYQRAFCQLAVKKGRSKNYDVINLSIDAEFTSKTPGIAPSKFTVTYHRENDKNLKHLDKEWAILGGEDVEKKALRASLDQIGGGPFALTTLLEGGLAALVPYDSIAAELDGSNVTGYGFDYHVGSDYSVDLDGLFGKRGSDFTIPDDISALKEEGDLKTFIFASKAQITERAKKVIPQQEAEDEE